MKSCGTSRRSMPCPVRRRKAAVLILVLIVLSALSLLALGLCHRVRLELKMARMRGRDLQAYYLALGGINRALVAIREDEDIELDHAAEAWHLNATAAQEGLLPEFTVAQTENANTGRLWDLSYTTSDEEGRLNLNSSSPAGWVKLPGMTENLVNSILDWQDADDSPKLGGAESQDYLRGHPPYRAKNLPTRLLSELAMIKGMTWSAILGEDANGNGLLDENENDGEKTWPMDNSDGKLELGLGDFFTTYGDGKPNLNTAGHEVLLALPEIDETAARAVCQFRAGPDGQSGTADDSPFRSFDDLAMVSGLTNMQISVLQSSSTLKSAHFRAIALARPHEGAKGCRLEGVFERTKDGVNLTLLRRD